MAPPTKLAERAQIVFAVDQPLGAAVLHQADRHGVLVGMLMAGS